METNKIYKNAINEVVKKLNMPYEIFPHFDGFIVFIPNKKYRWCDFVLDGQSYGHEENKFEFCIATFMETVTSDNILPPMTAEEAVAQAEECYKNFNKWLITEFPFLEPKSRFSGKVVKDYDYSFTELDALPMGWFNAFGVDMCREIKNALLECQAKDPTGGYPDWENEDKVIPYLEGYTIVQIKEKFGRLCMYDSGAPGWSVHDIISKYEKLSGEICIRCGKPAEYETEGWITYICGDCAKKCGEERLIKLENKNERT